MSAKKKNDLEGLDLDQVVSENLSLLEENTYLSTEVEELKAQALLFKDQAIASEDKYSKERDHRRAVQRENEELKDRVFRLSAQLEAAKSMRDAEQRKRHGSIPKFIIVAAVALLVLMTSFSLQKLSLIGPAVGYGIQCGAAMVIAWCYAIIFDRSRK